MIISVPLPPPSRYGGVTLAIRLWFYLLLSPSFDSTPESAEKSIAIDFQEGEKRRLEFKGRSRKRQRRRGASREVWDPERNMHVPAQLKVTNMNLSVTADYEVSGPHSD